MQIKWPHSGNVIIAGFIIMIILMSCLVIATTYHTPDMVSDNYYEKELRYQQNIDAMHNTAGMQFPMVMTEDSILITIPAALVTNLGKGEIKFYCPADSKLDKVFPLAENQQGYGITIKDWQPMQYIVMVSATTAAGEYSKDFPISIK